MHGILVGVSSSLSGIPIASGAQLAATVGLFAVLFVAVGLVATTGTPPAPCASSPASSLASRSSSRSPPGA